MPHKANPEHWKDLENVLTLAEACRRYKQHRQTLTYAIDANNLVAVRRGRSVLISKRSLEQYLARRS